MCRQSTTVCLTKSPTATERAANGTAERLAIVRDPCGIGANVGTRW